MNIDHSAQQGDHSNKFVFADVMLFPYAYVNSVKREIRQRIDA